MNCDPMQIDIGGYVLGALSAAETDAVRAHLADCPDCRREHDQLVGLPDLLATVPAERAEHGPARDSGAILAGLLAAASEGRHPRHPAAETSDRAVAGSVVQLAERAGRRRAGRSRRVLTAAACLAVVVAGGYVVARQQRMVPLTLEAAGPDQRVKAELTYWPTGGRTKVDLELWGLRPGDDCLLAAVGYSGEQHRSRPWKIRKPGYARYVFELPIGTRQVDWFNLVAADGHTMVALRT